MSDAKTIGKNLVALCNQGKNEAAIDRHYHQDIVSVEAGEAGGMPREMRGMQAIAEKNKWWADNHEIHSGEAIGPFPHGDDKFAVIFRYDITSKPMKQRMKMEEVAVFQVKDGKIVREEFFYET
jgi:ketosteroid isomerase-like protein